MVVVDTHVHLIAPDQRKYPRTLSAAHSEWIRETSCEQLIEVMDAAGVDRTVLVQAYGASGYDNSYAADAALAYPDRFAGLAIVDPPRAARRRRAILSVGWSIVMARRELEFVGHADREAIMGATALGLWPGLR
ncbi:MAG TPA: hypothetical protein VND20_04015 [Candidatus Binataceae bacterium]|nr:hypothetical protein [Candidatus Binataceae bacterium]